MVEIFKDDLKLLYSGSIVVDGDSSVRFSLAENFTVVFQFENDSVNSATRVRASVIDRRLILHFYNFNSSLGNSTREVIWIGVVGDKQIGLNYAVYTTGDAAVHTRIVHYSFFESPANKPEVSHE